jgi:hypothetical protein
MHVDLSGIRQETGRYPLSFQFPSLFNIKHLSIHSTVGTVSLRDAEHGYEEKKLSKMMSTVRYS